MANRITKNKDMFCDYFKDKKITIMGLGLLGRGINVTKFLAQCGAILTVTDLKTQDQLRTSLDELSAFKNITYVLGKHRVQDFKDKDMIIKSAGVALDSPFIAEAKKNNIAIEMDASLFARLSHATLIGITGTRGKSTTTGLIYHILQCAGQNVFLGGNVRGTATLPLLKKTTKGDYIVLELDSWQLQGFGDARLSPHIAVFTNMLDDHLNYYKGDKAKYYADKTNIFKFQKSGDFLITSPILTERVKKEFQQLQSKVIVADRHILPQGIKTTLKGEHNFDNISLAVMVARTLKIDDKTIFRAISTFKGLPFRIQLISQQNDVAVYNDSCATTPDAVLVALKTLAKSRNVILIVGGADKSLDMSPVIDKLTTYCKAVILLAGTGTDKIHDDVHNLKPKINVYDADTLTLAYEQAQECAKDGDVILFSPAFASFGMFKNEYDRGEQFTECVRG